MAGAGVLWKGTGMRRLARSSRPVESSFSVKGPPKSAAISGMTRFWPGGLSDDGQRGYARRSERREIRDVGPLPFSPTGRRQLENKTAEMRWHPRTLERRACYWWSTFAPASRRCSDVKRGGLGRECCRTNWHIPGLCLDSGHHSFPDMLTWKGFPSISCPNNVVRSLAAHIVGWAVCGTKLLVTARQLTM